MLSLILIGIIIVKRTFMKQFLLFLILSLCTYTVQAQLSCKTKPAPDGGTKKICLHKNGIISTSETWDKDRHSGSIVAYNNKSEELFNHSLRNFGGHASVSIDYYPNGQVSKIYFSDAPDGGIQFYNSTTKFDENGNQTEFYETRYPYELQTILMEPEPKENPVKEVVTETPKQEVVECAVLFKNFFEIQNATSSKVIIKVNALQNNSVIGKSKTIVLEPSQKLVFDTVFTAQIGLRDKIYALEIVSYTNKRKNKSMKLIEPGPIETTDSRTYYWFVVKD